MATFRTSTLPVWATKENNGYFTNAKAALEPNRGTTAGSKDEGPSSNRYAYRKLHAVPGLRCLPTDITKACKKLRDRRLMKAGVSVFFWHMLVFIVLFTLFPLERDPGDEKASNEKRLWFLRVLKDISDGMTSLIGISYILSLGVKMLLIGNMFVYPDVYATSYQDELKRFTSGMFLLKNVLLVISVNIDYIFLLGLFDRKYTTMFQSKESILCKFGEPCYYKEECIVVQLSVTVSALFVIYKNYMADAFTLTFLPVQPGQQGGLFSLKFLSDLKNIVSSTQSSIPLAICIGSICFLLGPVIFYTLFYPFGLTAWEDSILDRIFLYLSIGFVFRLFLYNFLVMFLLSVLTYCIQNHLVELVDFHVEQPPTHPDCLIMSNAMKGDSQYLRTLAFHEYNLKANASNRDIYVFFYVTHPGNHPLTWRNVFGASIETIKVVNAKLVKFLHSSKNSTQILQPFLPGHILSSTREAAASGPANPLSEAVRTAHMRDLGAMNEHGLPNEHPTISDLLMQNVEQLWTDVKTGLKSLLSVQAFNTVTVSVNLGVSMEEKVIANIVEVDHMFVYWAIMGSVNLMSLSVEIDDRGVVNQDIKQFMITLLDTYDVYTTVETYMLRFLEDDHRVNRRILCRSREIVSRMSSTCSFALAKLHHTYAQCYSILDVDEDLETRIMDVIANRDRS